MKLSGEYFDKLTERNECIWYNFCLDTRTALNFLICVLGQSLRPRESIQCGEAGCGDVPRCDDPLSGPTTRKQDGEAGCGRIPRCDDPPPGPMTADQHQHDVSRLGREV